jgi:hypothetical protein
LFVIRIQKAEVEEEHETAYIVSRLH